MSCQSTNCLRKRALPPFARVIFPRPIGLTRPDKPANGRALSIDQLTCPPRRKHLISVVEQTDRTNAFWHHVIVSVVQINSSSGDFSVQRFVWECGQRNRDCLPGSEKARFILDHSCQSGDPFQFFLCSRLYFQLADSVVSGPTNVSNSAPAGFHDSSRSWAFMFPSRTNLARGYRLVRRTLQ